MQNAAALAAPTAGPAAIFTPEARTGTRTRVGLALVRNDPRAEAQALREHERLIRYTARPFVRTGAALDDLMQEGRLAFLIAYRSWRREAALWTYARRFVLGAMFTAVGRALASPIANGDADDDAIDPAMSADDAALIGELLDCLTPEERHIVVCYVGAGRTLEDIAAETGRSFSGVRYVCDGALTRMRTRADVDACSDTRAVAGGAAAGGA